MRIVLVTRRTLTVAITAVAVAITLVLAGCSSTTQAAGTSGRLRVVAAFYPLQYLAERIGGDAISVASLTKPGAEPHDLELTAQDVAAVGDAVAVIYLRGFQPAVDKAVDTEAGDHAFDAAPSARLTLQDAPVEAGQARSGDAGAVDPHFWLDPTRVADVGDAFARFLGTVNPADAGAFTAHAASLRKDLTSLDEDYRTGLASCAVKDLVTSHAAFGYLARRYGLTQVGITGLDPEKEPSARDLANVTAVVRTDHVRTIYYETLVSPAIARTVASATGARTAVLDPIEGLTDQSAGRDYLQVMRSNLATLRVGQGCS
jgi:zinc transport system substrate-binding protein